MTKQSKHNQKLRLMALNNLGGCCAICQSKRQLEIHHTKYDGWKDRITGDKRKHVRRASKGILEGLTCLCNKCHKEETKIHRFTKFSIELSILENRYQFCIGGD